MNPLSGELQGSTKAGAPFSGDEEAFPVVTNRRRQREVMPSNGMFKGELQPSGDIAGVFEYDGEVA